MELRLEADEAWSLMSVISSYAIDNGGLSQEGKQAVRQWRTARALGTPPMEALAEEMNAALGGYLAESTNRQIRGKGRFGRRREAK